MNLVEMLAFVMLVHLFKPIYFDEAPLRNQVRIGQELERSKKGIDATLMLDGRLIGKWFDGRGKTGIEQAIWISPALVSRRLGWLQSRYGWTDQEVEGRWQHAREELNGRLTFLIKICAFPTDDVLDESWNPSGDVADLDATTASIAFARGVRRQFLPTSGTNVAEFAGYSREEVLSASLETLPQFSNMFATGFQTSVRDPNLDFGLGDYHSAYWLEQIPVPADLYGSRAFELQITTAKKKRSAEFAIWRTRERSRRHRK